MNDVERHAPHVLIVDARRQGREQARAALLAGSTRHCRVTEAVSAEDALQQCAQAPAPDCILLSFDLPDASALALLARLPRDRTGLPRFPVVALVSAAGHADHGVALRAGAHETLGTDGMSPASLNRAIANATLRHAMARVGQDADSVLRESEAFSRSLLDSSIDCVQVLDVAGHVQRVNQRGLALLEVDDFESLRGRPWAALWPPRMQARVAAALASAARGQGSAFEGPCPTVRGTQKWWEVSVSPVCDDASGRVLRLLVVARDVTLRRADEQALKDSTARLRLAIEVGGGFAFDWDPETDTVVRSNHSARLLGMPIDEEVFRESSGAFFDRIHVDDRSLLAACLSGLTPAQPKYTVGYRVVRPDGSDITFEETAEGSFNPEGRLVRLVGMTFDVTRRVGMEQALRFREHQLQTVTDNSPDILTRLDRQWRHVFVNAAMTRATGHPPEEFLGKSHRELGLPGALCDQWEGALRTVLDRGESQNIEFEAAALTGTRHYASQLVAERGLNGRIEHVLAVTRDITERKQIEGQREQLLEAERAARVESERVALIKDDFLATLSHELRTPLAAIVGWANVLKKSPTQPQLLRQAVDAISRNADAQARLIADLLDMNRIVSGKLKLDIALVDVNLVAAAATDTMRPAALAKGVALDLTLEHRWPAHVRGDATRLQQVCWNLLSNAIKFTPAGGRVGVTTSVDTDGAVVLSVVDTGKGMAPSFIPFLFDRFSQADGSAARVHGGLGLGLSIVKQLVELHGGSVGGSSAGAGLGASFVVRLPSVAQAAGAAALPVQVGVDTPFGALDEAQFGNAEGDADLRGVSVLLVDDQVDVLELGRRLLAECGASVVTAESAASALASLRLSVPDVLLSDIGMPDMDGYELIRQVRAGLGLAASRLPAAAITAFTRPQDRARVLQAGYQAYVQKPIQPQLLLQTVLELVAAGPKGGGGPVE